MATMLYNVVPLGAFCIHVLLRRILHDSQKKQVSNQHLGNVVLVIDIGSSSVRCSPYNISIENPNDIRLLVECTQKITYNLNQVNRKLIDEKGNESYPSTQILKIVDAVVSRCIHSLRCHGKDSVSINAIGISSFAMNIFGVNDSGDVCTPLFTYATSSTPTNATTTFSSIQALGSEAEKNNKMCVVIPTQEKEEKCHLSEFSSHLATTGTRLNHQSYAIAQLRSYTSEFPRESAAVAHWSTLSSMFISQWTEPIDPTTTVKTVEISPLSSIQPINVPFSSVSSSSSSSFDNDDMKNSTISPVSYSEASWMGLLNFKTRKWDEKSLSLSLINDTKLPPLTTFKILNNRKISSNVLLLYPELKNAVFYPGIGDGAAATVGTNCIGRNRISVTIGTSAAVRIIINDNNNNSNNNNFDNNINNNDNDNNDNNNNDNNYNIINHNDYDNDSNDNNNDNDNNDDNDNDKNDNSHGGNDNNKNKNKNNGSNCYHDKNKSRMNDNNSINNNNTNKNSTDDSYDDSSIHSNKYRSKYNDKNNNNDNSNDSIDENDEIEIIIVAIKLIMITTIIIIIIVVSIITIISIIMIIVMKEIVIIIVITIVMMIIIIASNDNKIMVIIIEH